MKLSATKCITYETCPQKYNYVYKLKLLTMPNKAMGIGTEYHEMLRMHHNGADDNYVKKMSSYTLTEEDKELLGAMFDKYIQSPVDGEIVSLEEEFDIYINGVSFKGIIDRMNTDALVEYKTTAVDYKTEDADTIQAEAYIYYVWKTTGRILPMIFSVNNKKKAKSKKYLPQQIVIEKTEADLLAFEEKIKKIADEISQNNFPAKPGPRCYSCEFGRKFGDGCCKESL